MNLIELCRGKTFKQLVMYRANKTFLVALFTEFAPIPMLSTKLWSDWFGDVSTELVLLFAGGSHRVVTT